MRRDKRFVLLLVLLALLSVAFGLYLASPGLHPRQLRRRQRSDSRHHVQSITGRPARLGTLTEGGLGIREDQNFTGGSRYVRGKNTDN
jgi:hypothetical protein